MAKQTQVRSTKATNFTFGVEIECTVPAAAGLPVGQYHRGADLAAYGFPTGWNCQSDGSVRADLPGYVGVEVVSPILRGEEGIASLTAAVARLNELGARANQSCGFHVHVGVESVAGASYKSVAEWLGRLVTVAAHYELALFGVTGSVQRALNHYCASVRRDPANERGYKAFADKMKARGRGAAKIRDARYHISGMGRYYTLNLQNVFGQTRTVEFRCFAGTTNLLKVLAYVQLVLGLCEYALRCTLDFDPPAAGDGVWKAMSAKGPAEKAVQRLLYRLGWLTGRADLGRATCTAKGYIGDLDQMAPTREVLLRLARKFDERATAEGRYGDAYEGNIRGVPAGWPAAR